MLSTISIHKKPKNYENANNYNSDENTIINRQTDIFVKDISDNNERHIRNKNEISDIIATIYGPEKQTVYNNNEKYTNHKLEPYVQKEISIIKENSFSELENKPHNTKYILTDSAFDAMIHYDNSSKTFNFYNKQKDSLGKFKASHIVDYVSSQFNKAHNIPRYDNNDIGCDLIKNFILKSIQMYGDNNVELYDYNDSAFMGDIESLILLNNDLYSYEEKDLENHLIPFDKQHQKKIKNCIKTIIYKLLIHTLKMISMASQKVSRLGNKNLLKNKLLEYSIRIVYRISKYVQDELHNYIKSNSNIEETLALCHKLRTTLDVKMDGAIILIKNQNENLVHMAKKMKDYEKSLQISHNRNYHLKGGYHQEKNKHNKHHKYHGHHKHHTKPHHYSSTSESYNNVSISSSDSSDEYSTSSTDSTDSTNSTNLMNSSGSVNYTSYDTTYSVSDSTSDSTSDSKYTEDDYLSSDSSKTDYDM